MGLWDTVKDVGAGIGNTVWQVGTLGQGDALLGGLDRTNNEFRQVDPNGDLARQGQHADTFASNNEFGFRDLGKENAALRGQIGDIANGKNSISAEQLRQGLQQNIAGQQAMAAGARGGNQAMMARQAMMNAGRMGSGMAGQQALAGIQERQAAMQSLGNMQAQQRQMELQAALQSRQNAMQAYGGIEQGRAQRFGAMAGAPTPTETVLGGIQGAAGAAMASDKRLKTNIKDADADATEFLKGLKAYSYDYKDSKFGAGKQLGVMAQDLEKTKFGKQAVINTAEGKMVHGAKLAGALAAATSSMNRRLEKLEGK